MKDFDENVMSDTLQELVDENAMENDVGVRVESFETAGILTYDAGFVIALPDGQEFQVTVVQSK